MLLGPGLHDGGERIVSLSCLKYLELVTRWKLPGLTYAIRLCFGGRDVCLLAVAVESKLSRGGVEVGWACSGGLGWSCLAITSPYRESLPHIFEAMLSPFLKNASDDDS